MTGPLGFIRKRDRTARQHVAAARAESKMVKKMGLPMPKLKAGQAVRLFDAWRAKPVTDDVKMVFSRFRQFTGSCVGVGGGNALFSLIAMQRLLSSGATKAFIPFWPFDYGCSRLRMGDHSEGEGSLGSTFAEALVQDGVLTAAESGLPQFTVNDGLILTEQLEYQWSDGDSQTVTQWAATAKVHPVGSAATITDVADVRSAILNGYPVTFACDNYIGDATIEGSGADACVIGYWDGSGGHQQSVHAVWDHPSFGPLYWAQNSWDGGTYPVDPAGGPLCGCWVREAKVQSAIKNLDSEVYALSHLAWFPAQPNVLDWFI